VVAEAAGSHSGVDCDGNCPTKDGIYRFPAYINGLEGVVKA